MVVAAVLGLACTLAMFTLRYQRDIGTVVRLAFGKSKRASFIHIPKAGGDTFRMTAARMGVPTEGEERCYQYMYRRNTNAYVNVVQLRDPRAHVLSQFSHCYANPYGVGSLKPAWGFPRGERGQKPGAAFQSGIDTWLKHFNSWHHGTDGYFNCYNPINMQARYLTCGQKTNADRAINTGAEHMGTPKKPQKEFYFQSGHYMGVNDMPEPDLPSLKARLDSMQVVAVTEAMKESLCLLEYKSRGVIAEACECGSKKQLPWHYETHGVRHPDLKRLHPDALRMINNITRVDRLLYRMGAQRLIADIEEAERELGKQFMCASGRKTLEAIVGDEETEHQLVGSLTLDWDTWDTQAALLGVLDDDAREKAAKKKEMLTVAAVVAAAAEAEAHEAAAAGEATVEAAGEGKFAAAAAAAAAAGEKKEEMEEEKVAAATAVAEEEKKTEPAPAMSSEKKAILEAAEEAAVAEEGEDLRGDPHLPAGALVEVPQLVPAMLRKQVHKTLTEIGF